MKNFDHYAAASRLSNLLDETELHDWAQRIRHGMSDGATGTEIFMMLRIQISEFLDSRQGSAEAISIASGLLSELNASFC